jgi:cell wall assembly regulator SMI1
MDAIAFAWRRIDTWFGTFAPSYARAFLPGVTEKELAEAEAILGVALPADVKASYRIHNGVSTSNESFLDGKNLYRLEGMIGVWKRQQALCKRDPEWSRHAPIWVQESIYPSQPVQPVWWHQAWLPFLGSFDNHWCLDLAPAPTGQFGQILEWDHEVGPWKVHFPSIGVLLSTFADQLEAGLYVQHGPPLIALGEITHLKDRRVAFQQRSAAKPALEKAIKIAWNFHVENDSSITAYDLLFQGSPSAYEKAFDTCTALYRQVLQMPEATPDDRFFAYYGLISLYMQERSFLDDPNPSLFEQCEAEASNMPTTHWAHKEVALWKEQLE